MSMATEDLAERIRARLEFRPGITEKKMFGGYGFMLNGNMICGAMSSGELLLRVGPELHEIAKTRPGARAMHQANREMVGFIEVSGDAVEDPDALAEWLDFAEGFVKTLPPKEKAPPKPRKKPATR